ncbi:ion transporter [Vibrio stylophorae]|uniref:ion transporter n=1 Tax=Vibrio stylophorae TaxID=659351 RepID=UPI001F1C7ED3|nr:ion transporter [Vibrio stylophorae]
MSPFVLPENKISAILSIYFHDQFNTMSTIKLYLQRIDESNLFQGLVIAVIVISALSVGAQTYELPNWLSKPLASLDYFITLFFATEISLRFMASKGPKAFFSKGWNIFDTLIVLASLIPITGSQAVFIARLLRIFRVLRLVSMLPDLRMLVNSLLRALPRMGYIALLMFVIFYIYGAVGAILFGKINDFLWGDVSHAMLTLFRVATFEDWTDVMYETMTVYPLSWIYYFTFIFLTAFIFLNMMVGAVLEVMTSEVEAQRKENLNAKEQKQEPATVAQVDALKAQIDRLEALLEKQIEQNRASK